MNPYAHGSQAHIRPVNLRALVEHVVAASDRQGRVVVDIPVGLVVSVDPELTEHIVDNLVTNAFEHTPPFTPVWIGAHCIDGDLELTVSDAGAGVPDPLKLGIFLLGMFDPCTPEPTPSRAPGTGVGLSLVSRFAALHGGEAWVSDDPSGGARFHVTFADAHGGDVQLSA